MIFYWPQDLPVLMGRPVKHGQGWSKLAGVVTYGNAILRSGAQFADRQSPLKPTNPGFVAPQQLVTQPQFSHTPRRWGRLLRVRSWRPAWPDGRSRHTYKSGSGCWTPVPGLAAAGGRCRQRPVEQNWNRGR